MTPLIKIFCVDECYGNRKRILERLRSYPFGRAQFVEPMQYKSTIKNGTKRVLQCSVRGPLLFVIYINEEHKQTDLRLFHYADDSTAEKTLTRLNSLADANYEFSKMSK